MSKPDEFQLHEALHMSLFLGEAVESQLIAHTFVKANPDCLELAEKANDALLELYQLIGAKRE
ncbi:hypothetical protein [Sneathiella sp.]|jgi:hypothetical protein|uniref:hypothetical protein n=1 Tax=Sneathiella sp. TaxID=1964365 RepID=UPI0039E3DAF1